MRFMQSFCLLMLIFVGTMASAAPVSQPDGTWVGGFYPSWSYWRGGSGLKSLDAMQTQVGSANFVTYAFLAITTNESLNNPKPTYSGIQLTKEQQGPAGSIIDIEFAADNSNGECPGNIGDPKWCAASHIYNYLKQYQANSGTEQPTILMASIGGWSYTTRFSDFYKDYVQAGGGDINSNPITKEFLSSTISWLTAHQQFGGINLDWEFPGFGHGKDPQGHQGEGAFYTQLVAAMRAKLDLLGQLNDKHYYLSAAVIGSANEAQAQAEQGLDWKSVASNVDWFDLMAFDLHGEFDAASGGAGVAQSMSAPDEIKKALDYYITSEGIDSHKIILGLPTYAREMLVADKPSADNNYGYQGNLRYEGINDAFTAFSSEYYQNNPAYFDYADNPNDEPYYPVGGMVDFTGVYNYACFLSALNPGSSDECPILSAKDNRGNQGVALPTGLHLSQPSDGIAWLSGDTDASVAANFTTSPFSTYPAYPVFTLDTQAVIAYKIQNLVQQYKLGGAWFWEATGDALQDPAQSLYKTAYNCLKKNDCSVSK